LRGHANQFGAIMASSLTEKKASIMNLPGGLELIIILVIVLLLFGVGRVSKIGGELGSAVANFRKGLNTNQSEDKSKSAEEPPKA
jgi:sec-independent protein translocase protein TatA